MRAEDADEQLAHVVAHLQVEVGVAIAESRHHDVGQQPLAGRHHVHAANPAQVGLDEAEALLPHRAGEVHQRVEPAEHRVVDLLARPPALAEPLLLRVGKP